MARYRRPFELIMVQVLTRVLGMLIGAAYTQEELCTISRSLSRSDLKTQQRTLNSSEIEATLAKLDTSRLVPPPKQKDACMPLRQKLTWPHLIEKQLLRTYGKAPLARTQCPFHRNDCLQAITLCLLINKYSKSKPILQALLRHHTVRRVIIVAISESTKSAKELGAYTLKDRINLVHYASSCASEDSMNDCSDTRVTNLTIPIRFVVSCETSKTRDTLARAAWLANTQSMLLVDTTIATSSLSTMMSTTDADTLLNKGLRTHLNHPYQICTYTLETDNSQRSVVTFAATLSVLDYGSNGVVEHHHDNASFSFLHDDFALHLKEAGPALTGFDTDFNQSKTQLSRVVHAVWSSDRAQAVGLVASVLSALEASSEPNLLAIHIIGAANCNHFLRKTLDCALATTPRRPRSISFYTDTITISTTTVSGHLSSEANFARFQLHTLLPADIKHIIWIDADTIVRADLAFLLDEFLEQQAMTVDTKKIALGSALRSASLRKRCCGHLVWPASLEAITGQINGECNFNAGILVFDLVLWRKTLVETIEQWFHVNRAIGPLWIGATQAPLLLATRNGNFATLQPAWNEGMISDVSLHQLPSHVRFRVCTSPSKPPDAKRHSHVSPSALSTSPSQRRLSGRYLHSKSKSGRLSSSNDLSSSEDSNDRDPLSQALYQRQTARILHFKGNKDDTKSWLPHHSIRHLWQPYGDIADTCAAFLSVP